MQPYRQMRATPIQPPPALQRPPPGLQWRHRRRCRPWLLAQAQQQDAAPAAHEADPLAIQRAELGRRVVRHVAGAQLSPDLADVLRPLPVHIEAPRAWATLADGVAVRGPQALRDALSPRPYPVPSFHTLAHCRCCLTSSRVGRRFRVRPINLFLALLFEQIPAAVALAGLPPVALDRYDLHHGHLFFAPGCRQLGILFHAKEYPAAHAEHFPVHLGNCQWGSSVDFDEEAMRWRNLLWLHGRLAALDLAAPALQPLLMPGLELPRTVLEHDLGQPLADLNYFAELRNRRSAERLFVCVPGE